MFSIILGSVTFVTSLAAHASPIFGFVEITDNRIMLRQEAENFEIQAATNDVSQTLLRLRSGDYLAFEGYISPAQRKAVVQSIDWVGLQRLIGYWRTNDRRLVEFANFTSMKFHVGKPEEVFYRERRGTGYETNVPNVSYRVAPSEGSSWSIFVSNQGKVKVGRLTLIEKNMTISFYDSETGRVTKTISLQKVPYFKNAYR